MIDSTQVRQTKLRYDGQHSGGMTDSTQVWQTVLMYDRQHSEVMTASQQVWQTTLRYDRVPWRLEARPMFSGLARTVPAFSALPFLFYSPPPPFCSVLLDLRSEFTTFLYLFSPSCFVFVWLFCSLQITLDLCVHERHPVVGLDFHSLVPDYWCLRAHAIPFPPETSFCLQNAFLVTDVSLSL